MMGKQFVIFLMLLVATDGFTASNGSQVLTQTQELKLYSSADAGTSIRRGEQFEKTKFILNHLSNGDFGSLDDYYLMAKLIPTDAEREQVVSSLVLPTGAGAAWTKGAWSMEDDTYSWNSESKKNADSLPVSLSISANTNLANYDELWLDQEPIPGIPPCEVRLMVEGVQKSYQLENDSLAISAISRGTSDKVTLFEDPVVDDEWQPKSYLYLAYRALGVPPDSIWRYVQDQNNVLLQKRFNLPLVNANELIFESSMNVDRVNLLVRLDNSRPILIENFDIPQFLSNGRQGVKVELLAELTQRFPEAMLEIAKNPNSHTLVLQEALVFVRGEVNEVVASKGIRNMLLLGSKAQTSADGSTLTLPVTIESTPGTGQRLRVSLRQLTDSGSFNTKSATLLLLPPINAKACALRTKTVRLVNLERARVARFIVSLDEWLRAHGGPFLQTYLQRNTVESPGIISALPFSILASDTSQIGSARFPYADRLSEDYHLIGSENGRANGEIDGKKIDQGEASDSKYLSNRNLAIFTPFKSTKSRISLPSKGAFSEDIDTNMGELKTQGVVLSFVGESGNINRNGELLYVSGKSRKIVVDWKVNRILPVGARFYVDVPNGAEQLSGLSLQLNFQNGTSSTYNFEPNTPLRLSEKQNKFLQSARLTIKPRVLPFLISIKEAVMFAPAFISSTAAFDTERRYFQFISEPTPKITRGKLLTSGAGRVVFKANALPTRLRAELQPTLTWLQALQLEYEFPAGKADSGCQIKLKFQWERGFTERLLCLDSLKANISIPARLLNDSEEPMGDLLAVDFELPSQYKSSPNAQYIALKFSLEGISYKTVKERLTTAAVGTLNGQPILPSSGVERNALAGDNFREYWISIPKDLWNDLLSPKRVIHVFDQSYFILDSIVAIPKSSFDSARLSELQSNSREGTPSHWPKTLVLACIAMIVFGVWRVGVWLAVGQRYPWLSSFARICLLNRRRLITMLNSAFEWLWRLRRRLDAIFAGLSVTVCILLVGSAELKPALALVLTASIMAFGGLVHVKSRCEPCSTLSNVERCSFVMGGGLVLFLALWSKAEYNSVAAFNWIVLPVIALAYLIWPWLIWRLMLYAKRWPKLASVFAWGMITVILFAVGIMVAVSNGENYWFTFGGITALLSIRAFLISAKSRLGAFYPVFTRVVYRENGNLYFLASLIALLPTAGALCLGLEMLGELFAVVAFYGLVFGAVDTFISLGCTPLHSVEYD